MLDSSPEDEDFPGRLLHQAALWDNRELLEDLLEGGQLSFINSQDSWGRTPLHAAAITENSSCLKLLLNAGADPNIQCGPRGENKTPLHLSAEHGHMKNVQLLLQNNANMFIKDLGGLTAKDLAKNAGHTECANEIKSAADAKERARLDIHTALRDACNRADLAAVEQLLGSLSGDTELIVNMAPSGANTLLFLACQMGNKEIVKILLDSGADGRYHPVTKYSPLYIACYHGHYEIVEMLLLKFPELIKQHTVEHWLPCHACCINGHAKVLELLFDFPYPSKVLDKFRDSSGDWQYHMAFNINDRDVTGQTILYLSSLLGNKKLLDVILKFKVRAVRVESENEISGATETDVKVSPTKRRISNGIQNILTKLNLSRENTQENLNELDPNTSVISPLLIDMYCNNNTETALHAAVKGKYYDIAAALLNAGSNPNAVIKAYMDLNETLSCLSIEEESNYGQSTALVEACRNRHAEMVDLLLSYGARDDDCKALAVVVNNHDDALTAKLLAMKAHPDPEYKINKKSMTDVNSSHFSIFANIPGLTYSALFPNTPTMINWHNQRCHLSQIRTQWIVDASLNLNPKLKQNPKGGDVALYAITRLDISNNSLTSVPLIIFQLSSLRTLNVSQNKIDKLPLPVSKINHRKKLHSAENLDYDCPVLEELYLQENKLDNIPEAIFRLPALTTLVIAKNKLQNLPYNIWTAPKLKELNVSFNLLRELPSADAPDVSCRDEFERLSVSSSDSQLSSYADMLLDTEQTDPEVELEEFRQTTVRYRKKDRSLSQVPLTKRHLWIKNVEVTEQILRSEELVSEKSSQLSYLNLSHNLFNSIPVVLPCLAVNLTRLDMAFNTLRSMSHITSYPGSLKQLDLSHNRITCWPSLPQVEAQDVMELGHLVCYCKVGKEKPVSGIRRHSERSVRNIVLHSVCSHRRHLRLDNLRTLILANNELSRVQLTTDDDGDNASEDDETERNQNHNKVRLMFPNLSMLDVSNNKLKEIPQNIYELCSLSVLNISGNLGINDLPPQMGLLSRLWNLNTAGCPLQEPLKAMIESKKYKTMDIIGYLKSVLEDARPYTRMKLMIVGVQGIGKTSLLEQLRAEGITRRKSEHWAKRMGNKNINAKTSRGTNMSTVGVDIGDWIYEKKIRNQSSHGPVIFRTWDFGGQKEYYATHQYFLSKRSLYLVVWKITDGHRGLNEIFQWLINIQARAPNSPVIIVGTHFDLIQDRDSRLSEDLQQLIRERFINVIDAEKCGLPRVLDTIEISCRTRHNVKLLCNLIYDTVFSLRPPGSKELLLEQKVPASYLMLEDVVGALAAERRANGLDPVMRTDQYKSLVTAEMQRRYGKNFRDWSELHQATLFLHDNGVLLHYEDATLKDLYFLDPQWLCDMLAHVVTIREINPFAQTGIMKLDDLNHIFKASNIGCLDARSYIVNLLNKFEVALTWDSRTLLIPSLLPSEEDVQRAQMYGLASLVKVKVPLRTRCREGRNRNIAISPKSVLYKDCDGKFQMSLPSSGNQTITSQEIHYQVDGVPSKKSITRLLLMSYFPSGFWSRLISRLLADDTIVDIIRSFFLLPKQVTQDQQLVKLLDCKVEWVLWQTGLQLMYGNFVLFRMRELQQNVSSVFHHNRLRLKQDGIWCDLDTHSMSILEIHFPVESLRIKPVSSTVDTESSSKIKEPVTIDPTLESTSKLLALAVDHIDILLEDWYPTLGTRFVHTSEGKFLVTRIVPCPKCLEICEVVEDEQGANRKVTATKTMEAPDLKNIRPRMSQDSYTSEGDSGVEQDSASSSRVSSAEGHPGMKLEDSTNVILYSWTVEECILAAYGAKCVSCPTHYDVPLSRIAPDTVFLDLGDRNLIKPEHIKRGRLLGRGAFGFVFCGTYRNRGTNAVIEVAMKMLQPVQPGPKARPSANMAYKAAQTKWDRDPVQYACKAYCTARQELNILLSLKHPNIVPFVGVCTNPLALVLDLAPLGALDQVLRDYKRSGVKVGPFVMQNVVLQVAKAIEYLHRQRIIYRDLKSENVLVWEMPSSYSDDLLHPVHVKLADYGISRSTLPSGTKGFGGTEGFMAPEIMRYNGEEEYTEKVDCFSFGMFLYELLTLHQPFEGYESVKECILEGGRPPLTYRETLYPSYCLDLMVLCWSQQPKDRPSASQIVSIASAPEFTHLNDVVRINHQGLIVATANVLVTNITDEGLLGSELWMISNNSRIDLLLATDRGWMQHHTLNVPIEPTCACTVMNTIWLGDKSGIIHAYSASFGHKLFSYTLEKNENAVEALLFVPKLNRVACSLANGRLFLLHSEVIPSTPIAAEGSFVMAELCSKSIAHCLCAPVSESNGKCELWSGESNGQLTIYTLRDQMVVDQESTVHFDCAETEGDVVKMLSNGHTLCTYIHPGCIIYQWDRKKRCIINKLDCSKLVPCSESLKSISIEEHLSPTHCQVTSLAVLHDDLYIGTTWGCIIIAEKSTLRPITVFRPYEEDVAAIVPMVDATKGTPLIATVGYGYRNLLARYTDIPILGEEATENGKRNIYALLWRAEHWNAN